MMNFAVRAVACLLLIVPAAFLLADGADDPKPFAEARVVLQLSDQERQDVVLDVANNLIKEYGGPDMIDIEIVTFGPGVRLLFAGNDNEARISSLADNGVRFYICENTLETMTRDGNDRPAINEHARSVQAGVAHIIKRVGQGFVLVRP